MTSEYVVQRYIANPFLLGGLKFDMRIYVVVTSVVPLRAYLFKEGLARFCTVPYKPPKDGNLQNVCMHLTNFAVNKQSKDFQVSECVEQHDEGSKRSISSVFWQIEQAHGTPAGTLWEKIAELTANTLMALRPGLLEWYLRKPDRRLHPAAPKGFQILGMDVLLDSQLNPKLIELNANPSLSILQPAREQAAAPNSTSSTDAALYAAVPAGSAMQAARAARDGAGTGTVDVGSCVTLGPVDRDELSRRICNSLQELSTQDMEQVAAYIDSLRSGVAADQPGIVEETTAQASIRPVSPHTNQTTASLPTRPSSNPPSARPSSGRHQVGQQSASLAAGPVERVASASLLSKQRLGVSKASTAVVPDKQKSRMVTSPLDLEIKRELVAQALLLVRPAPQNKITRLRRVTADDTIPLDDEGAWAQAETPDETRPEIRSDAPERCPALEALDFGTLVVPDVAEFAQAHYALYRVWCRHCAPAQETVGQGQMMKLFERRNFVGPDRLFPDRIAAQLWLTKLWRIAADGAFGVDFKQFVYVVGRMGCLLLHDDGVPEAVSAEPLCASIRGVLEFVRHGGAGLDE
jgi:hypothetical protein